MPSPVIEISEVAQVIIDRFVQVSPKSVVALVCTRKALEELAILSLWSEQDSLQTLVTIILPDMLSLPLPQEQVRNAVADIQLAPDCRRC